MASVSFSIEPAFIMNHYRNHVIEGNGDSALINFCESFLDDNGNPLPLNMGKRILKGEAIIFEKDGGMYISDEFEDEDEKAENDEYRAEIESTFLNQVLIDGEFYLPVAKIPHLKENFDNLEGYVKLYLKEGQTYRMIEIDGEKTPVVFHPAYIEIPTWLVPDNISDYNHIEEVCQKLSDSLYVLGNDVNDLMEEPSYEYELTLALYENEKRNIQERVFKQKTTEWTKEIVEQAEKNGGFIPAEYNGNSINIPKVPFLNWGFKMTHMYDFYEDLSWECVSPFNLKMMNDDPDHSDWMLGAGLDIEDWYDNQEMFSFFYNLVIEEISKIDSSIQFLTLSGTGEFKGSLKFVEDPDYSPNKGEIISIPHSGIEFWELAKRCAEKGCGIIAQTGGVTSHLAVNAHEHNIQSIVLPSVKKQYKEKAKLIVNLDKSTIKKDWN